MRRTFIGAFYSFWKEDRGLSVLLLALLAGMFAAPPLVALGLLDPLILQILFSIILFGLIYLLLGGLWIFLLKRKIDAGPEGPASAEVL